MIEIIRLNSFSHCHRLKTPIISHYETTHKPLPIMKASLRQKFLIAVGLSAGLLASFNMFAQAPATPVSQYTISSQQQYQATVASIQQLATQLYQAHVKYPELAYSHVYDANGTIMGFNVTGVRHSSEADAISFCLMELELLGDAVNKMDYAYLTESKNEKLSSRVSKKKAMNSDPTANVSDDVVLASGANPSDLMAANK